MAGPAGSDQSSGLSAAPSSQGVTATTPSAALVLPLDSKNASNALALTISISDTPNMPNTGAKPASGESIWLYPSVIQGKPDRNQPRSHSRAIQTVAAIATNRHGCSPLSVLISQPAAA